MGRRRKANINYAYLIFVLVIIFLLLKFSILIVLTLTLIALGIVLAHALRLRHERAVRLEQEKRARALKLADIDEMDGIKFEHYVGALLAHRGFKTEVTQASSDLGVDVIARKGKLKYAVQVKRYSHAISRRAVSDAVAGKDHYKCNAAMVVTNNYFTEGAKMLAGSTGCELVDREVLAGWILDFQAPKTQQMSLPQLTLNEKAGWWLILALLGTLVAGVWGIFAFLVLGGY